MSETEAIRRLHVRLNLADGVGPILFRRLLEHFGTIDRVLSAGPGALRDVEGVGDKTARAILDVTPSAVDDEFSSADKRGVRILCRGDGDYPVSLKNIYDPPPVLYVRGQLQPTDTIAMAIVGSRHCTHYGLEQAERFGGLLGRAGFTVVSGGARGIDTASHRGAMLAGGRTIAVMGCGLEHVYPQENRELFDQIAEGGQGAVVSTLPMATAVTAQNFPPRNRIISGLSQGVLVVEAARKSGSLITANLAGEQGRIVFAIPGKIDSPYSQGTNQLIRDGAILTQCLEDILEQLGEMGRMLAAEPTAQPAPPPPLPVDETEARILAVFDGEPLGIDQLASATRLPAHRVIAAMTMLTLKGLIAQQPGNVFIRKRA